MVKINYAIRAADGKFYDRNGVGLAKGFLRFPTAKQFRISSNFNPRRLKPGYWTRCAASWR
ncbi:Cell wall endopeptidase family M23/M37 [Salmonella enterica subsp. enterica]|uniref:Cell wall endopeptidase family M23/M37 n=1 Tax=Salmonella enterica I TaxID=59201 RepID=A0A3S4F8U7_SALET|nr:Cell wall endopeptidase family M23/M37 [Salmonella enterica subsp. enterica]